MNTVFFYAQLPITGDHYFKHLRATVAINQHLLGKTFLYVPENTPIPDDVPIQTIVRMSSRQRHYPHLMRVLSWQTYLKSDHFDDDTAFLDADMLLNRTLSNAFTQDFCLAFSAAPSIKSYSTFNSGLILARPQRREEAITAIDVIANIATQLKWTPDPRYPQFRYAGIFGVDEMCLAKFFDELAAIENRTGRDLAESVPFSEAHFVKNTSIQLLGRTYNSDVRLYLEENWPKSTVLHFQGDAKALLLDRCQAIEELRRVSA